MNTFAPTTGVPSGPSTWPETTTGAAVSPTMKGDVNCAGSETGNAATAPRAPGPGLTRSTAPAARVPAPNDSWNPPAASTVVRAERARPSVAWSWTVGGTGSGWPGPASTVPETVCTWPAGNRSTVRDVTPASIPTAVRVAGGTAGSSGLTTRVYWPVESPTWKNPLAAAPAVCAVLFTPGRSVLTPFASSCTLAG